MADIDAIRPVQLAMHFGLERQQGEHEIDRAPHGTGAAGAPHPDARRYVFDDRQMRQPPPHPRGDAMSKIGGIDEDQHVGRCRHDRVDGLAQASQQQGELGEDAPETDRDQIVCRIKAREAGCAHTRPTDAAERDGALGGKRAHETGAEIVGGALARDHEDVECATLPVHGLPRAASSAGTPTTKSPALSAVRTICSRSAVTALCASTAMPARPAAAAASTVRAPTDGRSKRRSWVGFGALMRTPIFDGSASVPSLRNCAMRASIRSVPSAASTAITRLPATTTAWPTSKAPIAASSDWPTAMSARSRSEGAWRPSWPAGTRISGATSCAPTRRKPMSSTIRLTRVSR